MFEEGQARPQRGTETVYPAWRKMFSLLPRALLAAAGLDCEPRRLKGKTADAAVHNNPKLPAAP